MTGRGWTTTSQRTSDSFERLKRLALRRGWIPAVLPVVAFAILVITAALLQPSAANPFFSNVWDLAAVFVLLAAGPLTWAYSLVRSVRRLSALKSRVVETAWPLRGPVVMLEDGLVIS